MFSFLRRKKYVHCALVIFSLEHDFQWALSFHSVANLRDPLLLFALPFSRTSEGYMDINKRFGSSLLWYNFGLIPQAASSIPHPPVFFFPYPIQ